MQQRFEEDHDGHCGTGTEGLQRYLTRLPVKVMWLKVLVKESGGLAECGRCMVADGISSMEQQKEREHEQTHRINHNRIPRSERDRLVH